MRIWQRFWSRWRRIPRRVYVFSFAGAVVLLIAVGGILYSWDYGEYISIVKSQSADRIRPKKGGPNDA
jgi:hypothetical protein